MRSIRFLMLLATAWLLRAPLLRAGEAPPSPPLGSADFRPSAARPVGWRGDGSGRYLAAEPVTKWSKEENVLWKTEVGAGYSSPVLAGDRVLITAEPDLLVCLDAASGKELWRKTHKVSDLPAEWNAKDAKETNQSGHATPVPVSDGKWVWVFFDSGVVACYDLEGKNRWLKWYEQRQTTNYGHTVSPVLIGERLLVHFGPLVCLDAGTGKVLWQNDTAKATYGTPAPARIGDVDVVATPKGQIVRVADGQILASDLGNCSYPSPVVLDGVVYFIDQRILAAELPQKAGDAIEAKELWFERLEGEFYASPVVHDGRVYAVDKAANYYVIDARTGKTLFTKTLDLAPAGRADGPNVYPSICLAGKLLFVGNDAGEAVFLELGDNLTVVAKNSLPDGSGGTPTFSGKRMFIRGGKLLYCIGR